MCQACSTALMKFYPSLPSAEAGDFLMSTTSFPFGDPEEIERQLKDIWDNTDGTIAAAYAYASDEFDKDCREMHGNEEYESWQSPPLAAPSRIKEE